MENAVNLAYQRIYYPIKEMTFFSLEKLNQEIKTRLTHYNRLLFQRKEASSIIAKEGKGYSLMEGYRIAPVMFTWEQANALITAKQ